MTLLRVSSRTQRQPLSDFVRKSVLFLRNQLSLINTPYDHASDKEKMAFVKEACVKANTNGFITELPLGYETVVDERGFLLSHDQK